MRNTNAMDRKWLSPHLTLVRSVPSRSKRVIPLEDRISSVRLSSRVTSRNFERLLERGKWLQGTKWMMMNR